jgi:flagellar hook-associated protein 3 FlgL
MRVTMSMLSERIRSNLMASSDQLLRAQNVVTTGKRISTPSDDPIGTGKSLSLRSALASIEQYSRNTDIAQGQLSVTSAALDSVVGSVQQLRTLAISAASPAITTEARVSLAAQIEQIGKTLANTGNTLHMGKYIFSGSLSNTQPIIENVAGSPPYLYQGDSNRLNIRIGPGSLVQAGVTGDVVFNMGGVSAPGAPDVFTMIRDLRDAVLAGDVAAMSGEISDIDANLGNAISIRSQVGETLRRLDLNSDALADSKINTSELLSRNEDADMAEALVALRVRENVYQAAISTAGRLLDITLADFLQ